MRIYIVEDDISIISILEDIIETHNLGEICGDCGGEVANISDILRCKPDVVLVDFFMPAMDGVEVVNEIRKLNSTIKFIMISQVSSKELIGKAYSGGIYVAASVHGNDTNNMTASEAVKRIIGKGVFGTAYVMKDNAAYSPGKIIPLGRNGTLPR